jgi:hypothetical protein
MEDTMSFLIRTMLPAFALTAMMTVAQAQTNDQDHNAHHPDGTAQTQAVPQSGGTGIAPMTGQGMGSGMVVQPGAQQPGGQPGMTGMMGNMGQMMPMMRQMMGQQEGMGMGMGPGMGMGMPFEHVEGRIAFLKAELRITDAQKPQWDAFADAMRANSKAHQAVHEQMTGNAKPSSWPEHLAFQQKALSTRLDGLKTLETAAKPLFATLSDEQRKLADQLLSGPMGMM